MPPALATGTYRPPNGRMLLVALGKRHNVYVASLDPLRRPSSTFYTSSPISSNHSVSLANAKRTFNTYHPARNPLDDYEYLDDIEEIEGVSRRRLAPAIPIGLARQDAGDIIRRQNNKDQMRARSAIQVLPGFKRNRPRRVHPEATASAERIKRIEGAVSSARHKTNSLISEYCRLKFARFADDILRTAGEVRLLKHEYCLVATALLQRSKSALDHREHEARRHQIDLIEQITDLSRQRLAEIDRLLEEISAPRLSARRRVDADLETLNSMQASHDYLQGLVRTVKDNSILLQRELRLLVEISSRPTIWKKHLEAFHEVQQGFSRFAHIYRSIVNIKRLSQSQFAEAWPFKFYLSPAEERRYRYGLSAKRSELSNFKGKSSVHSPSNSARFDSGMDALEGFYFRHSESQRDGLWHLHRRQLDTMAPFLTVDRSAAAILKQVNSLSKAMGNEMWRNLSYDDIQRHKRSLSVFLFQYAEQRVQSKIAFVLIWHMNWMRLKAEDRLRTLCGLDIYLGKEFVISKPLSQNLIRFQQWADELRADEERAMSPLVQARTFANSNSRDLPEPDDIEDEDARGSWDPELLSSPLLPALGSGQVESPANKPWMPSEEDYPVGFGHDTAPTSTIKRRHAKNSQARTGIHPKGKIDPGPHIDKARTRPKNNLNRRADPYKGGIHGAHTHRKRTPAQRNSQSSEGRYIHRKARGAPRSSDENPLR